MQSPSQPFASGRRRLVAAAAAAGLIAAGAAAIPTSATAADPAPVAPAATRDTHTVTLITGDVVTVTSLADGRATADVDRPDSATGGVRIQESGGDLYVLPEEALPLLDSGTLDRRLFNVTDLIEMGYDDARSTALPLIATYSPTKGRATRPATPRGTKLVRDLPSITGAALAADKKQARAFWSTVAPAPNARSGATLGGGVGKLWLDGRVTAGLKESVPQVGAPEAWAAGYDGTGVTVAVLDTGVDAAHPDLAAQIDDKASFVPGEDTSDVHGHGTHVASTIAGTGTASGGAYRGVAPGADLIVGKVLNNAGQGLNSWIIAGMQWAAESGADVVNMSLGDSSLIDGTDPMALAVETLTARHGTLFVVAAGNSGPQTIGSPGTAPSALTVGAVDKQDQLAWFSSTGPLARTGALKPDVTAPGVDITAARSQQTTSGTGMYQSMDGTSMATPHVAGAAAILAQRHPEWTGPQLKEALTSSAKGLADEYQPYQVGTGRLDVAAATRNTVRATGSAFFGAFDWPHESSDAPVTRQVTVTNSGTTAVTLNLALTGGGPFTLGASSVTVPAGGTAAVPVTGDPRGSAPGQLTGYLVGTDAATGTPVTRTALALFKEDERYDLTIKLRGRDGKPASATVVVNQAGARSADSYPVSGERTLRLPPGTYTVETVLDVPGERPDALGFALLVDPETVLDRSTEVVLDASRARLLDTATPERTEDRQRKLDFTVQYAGGASFRQAFQLPVRYDDLYLSPTEPVTQGSFTMSTRWRKGEPMLSLTANGLLPIDTVVQPGSTLTAGKDTLRPVYAGTGAPGEYAGVDARGAVAVVTRSDAVSPAERAAAAAAAGAKLLLVVNDGPGVLNEHVGDSPIPVATVHRDAGRKLVEAARAGAPKLTVTRTPYASYLYDLARVYPGQVPDQPLTYHPGRNDLARIDARYHAVRDGEGEGYRYDMTFSPSFGFREREWHPGTRTEWVTPDVVWHEVHIQDTWTDTAHHNSYAKNTTTALNWFAPAVRPAFSRTFALKNGRYRDYLQVNVQTWSPSGDTLEHGGHLEWGSVPTNLKLYQGDTLLHENKRGADLQWKAVPAGTLPYRLVLDASRPAEQWRLSTRTHTEWDFVSSSNQAENFVPFALLQLDYALETDLRGDVKAGTNQQISIKAGPQPGGTGTGTVASVGLEVSYDDGATWQPVTLSKGADDRWTGSLKLPKQPGGFVSVRADARTDAGFGIRQELIRAYGLR
ncbi:Serine protease, subtilisin family [Micromonospora pallida]|uniref:Serine protease, subtilisin family n=1 Tax=Micromonospora pallida TaxID=145854 RepID=A0A1C6SUE9_9ACTN|nr:S8 family serine peptidase [Micromonospora pallida]SCL33161.1 Serine protease, subtilisin family [Micromonospora pallida]